MTLLYFDGFQDVATMLKPEAAQSSGTSRVATGRDGQTNGGLQTNSTDRLTIALPSAAATCILGVAQLNVNALSQGIGCIEFNSAAATVQLTLVLNSSGFIEARKGANTGTLLGTSSGHTPIAQSEWDSIQAKVVLHTTAGSVEVKLRTVTVLTLSGVSTSTVSGSVTHVTIGNRSASTGIFNWDDLWVCDAVDATSTQGRPNNDYLGDLRVQTVLPTGDGDTDQWTPSTGSSHSALVDEVPPNTSDYNSDSTSGHRDLVNVTDLVNAATVYGVRESIYAAKSDSGTRTIKPVVKENSVVTSDTAQGLAVTFAGIHSPFHWVRPSDSGLWTVTDANNMQLGVEVG